MLICRARQKGDNKFRKGFKGLCFVLGKKVKLVFRDRGFDVTKYGILTSIGEHLVCFEPDDGSGARCVSTLIILKIEEMK